MHTCVCDGKNSCAVPGEQLAILIFNGAWNQQEEQNRWFYNPKAVVSVMLRGEFKSYWSWSETASYDAIVPLMYQRASVFN